MSDGDPQPASPPVSEGCWRTIGVQGDGSCPELARMIHCRNCPVFARAGQQLFEREPPAELIEEWTRQLARDQLPPPVEQRAVLVFRAGREWLALDLGVLVEVAAARVIHSVPQRSNPVFRGLANIRGELHLCASLGDALGIRGSRPGAEKGAVSTQRLLVVESPAGPWALLVDEVAGVHHLALAELGETPVTVSRGHVSPSRGVFRWEGRRVGYVAADRLFEVLQRSIE